MAIRSSVGSYARPKTTKQKISVKPLYQKKSTTANSAAVKAQRARTRRINNLKKNARQKIPFSSLRSTYNRLRSR